ncbi:protein translocase SEC61 complex subunit gamma [Ignicoccus hospitalis]|uniref:Protein translocase subunit SecE n=1 Tax=Ignicoccus hospitalis (strain KIN4/I / DSM 18386 / JCM 14125) TaxID=453591 RepID=A8ABQ3_IGNH4|nr:protein translocase SEC61 complex subunit gamma [Ignicoccus hospitalis]ABU82355.1 protein translocase SEC61 complex, gamma subunit [Ignicoccus hospitalis KIN4/I]HIH89707.1 protein translocase SEC61 complex subunit gamma [Desulfurococcaceae archaeon]
MKDLNRYLEQLRNLMNDWRTILALASKPDEDEFKTVLKVVGLSTLIIAALAYIIRLVIVLMLYG